MSLLLFKQAPPQTPVFIDEVKRLLEDLVFGRIRCPLCGGNRRHPALWACQSFGTPEPFFGGCETIWNTFETPGRVSWMLSPVAVDVLPPLPWLVAACRLVRAGAKRPVRSNEISRTREPTIRIPGMLL